MVAVGVGLSTSAHSPDAGVVIPADFATRPDAGGGKPRRERTRAKILEAAGQLFNADGFDETSMHAIAEAAGMGVGTLYGYFASKDDILREVLFTQTAPQIDAYRQAVATVANGLDRILFSYDLLMAYIDANNRILRAVASTIAPTADARAQPLEWLYQSARALLVAGQAQGHVRIVPVDTTARFIVNAVIAAGLGQGTWRGVEGDPEVRAELRSLIRDLLAP